jgi:hypothetical protein
MSSIQMRFWFEIFYIGAASGQGDQIGRIFANWAAVYFGLLLENYKSGANYWDTFFHDAIYVLILTKNGSGYI